MANLPNQNNYRDNQNNDVNIDEVYSDFIQTIDKNRSYVNISNPNNINILKNFTIDTFNGPGISATLKPEITPQESRCHAFFRLVGFPVVSKDLQIYNPGHDILIQENRSITSAFKTTIANNPLPGFQALSDFREAYINKNLTIFSNVGSIDSSVLAISSTNVREFISPLKNEDAIESSFDVENASYNISPNTLIGTNDFAQFLSDFQDNNGNKPEKYTNKRYHIIKPFIVDARIDLACPAAQKVAIPFVPSDSYLKIGEAISVKRPLIEKIIIDRFNVSNQASGIGAIIASGANFIRNIPGIKDIQVIKDVSSGNLYKNTEVQIANKFINIISAMMKKLVEAQNTVKKVQAKYYWVPEVNSIGPEGGSKVQAVFDNLYNTVLTDLDIDIVTKQSYALLDQVNLQMGNLNSLPDPGGYAFGKFTLTFDPTTSKAFGDSNAKGLEKLVEVRNHEIMEANEALREIEVIMGEFSGFGLCDIVAIIGGLYLMPQASLLGFLDIDSLDRAKSFKATKLSLVGASDITSALNDLTASVKSFYNLMDQIYLNVKNNNL